MNNLCEYECLCVCVKCASECLGNYVEIVIRSTSKINLSAKQEFDKYAINQV